MIPLTCCYQRGHNSLMAENITMFKIILGILSEKTISSSLYK